MKFTIEELKEKLPHLVCDWYDNKDNMSYPCNVDIWSLFSYILHEECYGSYQGEIYFLLKHKEKDLFCLIYDHYGSCSDCDVLKSIETWTEFQKYIENIQVDFYSRDAVIQQCEEKIKIIKADAFQFDVEKIPFFQECLHILRQDRK